MKKLLLIILILLPCELGAQEGCGEWVKCDEYPRGNLNMGSVFIVWIDGHYEYFDSVWVPKPCPDTTYTQADAFLDGVLQNKWWWNPETKKWESLNRDSVRSRQMTIVKQDTLYTDWMYADSIYVFHFGRKFVWKKSK